MNKDEGLYQKYIVQKISNPDKKIDAIVLEFDDPIARVGITHWAQAMLAKGYKQCFRDVMGKVCSYAEHGEEPVEVSVFSENLGLKSRITKLEQKLERAEKILKYYEDWNTNANNDAMLIDDSYGQIGEWEGVQCWDHDQGQRAKQYFEE